MSSNINSRDIAKLINHRELRRLHEILTHTEPSTIAHLIAELVSEEAIVIFRILPRPLAAETFECLSVEQQQSLINSLGDSRVKILLNEMAADDRTALFEELPASVTKKLLTLLSTKEREIALTLLSYPEFSVGRLMTPEYITVQNDWDMNQVLDHLRAEVNQSEALDVVYVTSPEGKLTGQLKLRSILLATSTSKVCDVATSNVISISAYHDQEEAVRLFSRHSLTAIPVVDSQDVVLGVVTIDDVLIVANEEATEDTQLFGGTHALDYPYLDAPFATLVRSRASWLIVLLLGEMLTASAMAHYEDRLKTAVTLALFLPLIISSGGNAGSQAATLIIRSLSTGDLTLGNWFKVFKRELGVGLILGTILALVGLIRVAIWGAVFGSYGDQWVELSLTVATSLIFVVLWGTITGSMFPLILKKLGADPATSSAPMVATVVDVIGLIIYFSLAGLYF